MRVRFKQKVLWLKQPLETYLLINEDNRLGAEAFIYRVRSVSARHEATHLPHAHTMKTTTAVCAIRNSGAGQVLLSTRVNLAHLSNTH